MQFYASAMNSVSKPPKFLKERTGEMQKLIDAVYTGMEKLEEDYREVLRIRSAETAGRHMYSETTALMNELRAAIDRYEVIASKEFYHLPSYEEMLFSL